MKSENNCTQPSKKVVLPDKLQIKPLETESVLDEYYLHARPEILELVPLSARKVLDVGCGAGGFGATLKNRQAVEVHGVELVAEAAETAKKYLDQVQNKAIEDALPDLQESYYDCIIAADILEHLTDPWAVLTALKNKLAPNGRIILSIPNIQNWEILADLVQGNWRYQNAGILDRTHYRFFTRKSAEELVWRAGLRIIGLTTTKIEPAPSSTLLKNLSKEGLSPHELYQDGQTYQFIIEAETPLMEAIPKVTIIIFSSMGSTIECLESIKKINYQNYEVILVDNIPEDRSIKAIAGQYPDVKLLQINPASGYTGANNVGIQYALDHNTDYILILNDVNKADPKLVSTFVNSAKLLPKGSVLGAKAYYYDEPDKIISFGGLWNFESAGFKELGLNQHDNIDLNSIIHVDYVSSCGIFSSANTFREIGLFDESFFLNYSDIDWCYRARLNGCKCIAIPDAKIWHKTPSVFYSMDLPINTYFRSRNLLLWARKHLPRSNKINLQKKSIKSLQRSLFPKFIIIESDHPLLKRILWAFHSWLKITKKNIANPINKANLLGIRDYYMGRFGDCPSQIRKY